MVKKEVLMNKDGQPYLTVKGEELVEYVLEEGDLFVPQINNAIVKSGKFISYSMPVNLKDKIGQHFDNIFVKLTETQANAIKKVENITETLFKAVEYENKYGKFIGFEYLNNEKKWTKIVSNLPKKVEDFEL